MIMAGALNGAGATIYNLFIFAITVWGCRLPLAYVLGHEVMHSGHRNLDGHAHLARDTGIHYILHILVQKLAEVQYDQKKQEKGSVMTNNFNPITLDCQDKFDEALAACPQHTSDFTFANIWGWTEHYGP